MDANRTAALAPRVAVLVGLGLLATAGAIWAAGHGLPNAGKDVGTVVAPPPLVVPDVRGAAFVFAKGALRDAGFAWHVRGPVHGYPANEVAVQSPAPGSRVLDTGAPLVQLTLRRDPKVAERGTPEDESPYPATTLRLTTAGGKPRPTVSVTVASTPAVTVQPTVEPPATKPRTTSTPSATLPNGWPKHRPPAFVVPGGRPEPLDEMPLPNRAAALARWFATGPKPTNANVRRWLFQSAWIVAGAKLGWWHGAAALRTLVVADGRAESLWGIGSKSRVVAQRALIEVQARAKP